jgi:CDP-diacylglycerol---glycerol-3-phosphate 3-phosphatidyltransferase
MTIDSHRRDEAMRVVGPVGAAIARLGITANGMTAAGLVFAIAAAAAIATDRFLLGGVLLAVGGIADLLDGSVARARGGTTRLGGFYDSVADRVSDGAVLGAVAWAVRDEPLAFGFAVTALIFAEVTSYTRAKAESLAVDCSVGLLERAERTVILIAGLVFARWALLPALAVLAAGALYTTLQRVVHVVRQLRAPEPGA